MKLLHIDIETAPNKAYVWGFNKQIITIDKMIEPGYTLCYSAKWHDKKEVMFHSIREHGMMYMLKTVWELLDEADAVVHYNGTSFDIPTLNWEFLQHGIEPPSPCHQIDLYKTVRSRFRLPSYKLDYVCQALGLGAKVSHKGMALWHDCMNNDSKAWKKMEQYNKQDVRLLPKLYDKLLPWINDHPNHALYVDSNKPVCPNCGSTHVTKRGVETTKTQKYQRYKCMACKTPLRGRFTIVDKDMKHNILTQAKIK